MVMKTMLGIHFLVLSRGQERNTITLSLAQHFSLCLLGHLEQITPFMISSLLNVLSSEEWSQM